VIFALAVCSKKQFLEYLFPQDLVASLGANFPRAVFGLGINISSFGE
jgi:hypothetical protein